MYKNIFENVDKLNDKYVELWAQLCKTESPTSCKEGVDAVGKLCISIAKQNGWDVEILPQKISGDCICITMNKDAHKKPVSLSAHMDTVHPVGLFGKDPVRFEGDIIYGPGVADCKGGVALGLLVMHALKESGFCSRPVQLLLQSDEENNSKTSNKETINYICDKAKDSVAFLNCEMQYGDTAVLIRKGIVQYEVSIKGRAEHSAKCYEGVNAILEACHKIIELEKYKDENGVTCNCGCIKGGTALNSVAEQCSFLVDVRYATNEQCQEFEGIIEQVANTSYIGNTTCTLTKIGHRAAMSETRKNTELLSKMNKIFEKCNLPQLEKRISLGGSDACDVTSCGIPCVDSIGVHGDLIHSEREFAYVSSLKDAAKRVAAVVYGIED